MNSGVSISNLEAKGDDKGLMSSKGASTDRNVLAFKFNGFGVLVALMLITSLTLNVVALTIPFMVIRAFGENTESYSILRTVSLMWHFKFYVLAILIVIFSVCFPFVKIFSMFLLWYLPVNAKKRTRLLHMLCSLGRWSLLDVFVSLVLIVLSHDQNLLVTNTKAGLPLFMIAICLSMGTGQLMAYLSQKVQGERPIVKQERIRAATNSGWRKYVVPSLFLVNIVALAAAIGFPYVKITAWYLKDNTYSILDTVAALWADEKIVFSLVVLAFLVIMPVMRLLFLILLWYRRMLPRRFKRAQEIARDVRLWSMLDVFVFSFVLFLAEGGRIVKIEQSTGIWALIVAIVISQIVSFVTRQVIRARLAEIVASDND